MRRLGTTGRLGTPERLGAGTGRRHRRRRPFWLWVFATWLLGLGIASVWRALVLWQVRALLAELGSQLSPIGLTLFVILFVLCGLGLGVSAVGLWWCKDWARRCAQVLVCCYMIAVQAYIWLAAQSGLLLARRWVSLVLAVIGMTIGVGALSWRTSRRWLGLGV